MAVLSHCGRGSFGHGNPISVIDSRAVADALSLRILLAALTVGLAKGTRTRRPTLSKRTAFFVSVCAAGSA